MQTDCTSAKCRPTAQCARCRPTAQCAKCKPTARARNANRLHEREMQIAASDPCSCCLWPSLLQPLALTLACSACFFEPGCCGVPLRLLPNLTLLIAPNWNMTIALNLTLYIALNLALIIAPSRS
eukprot:47975-Chlamydomonas_euryale.AAC.3